MAQMAQKAQKALAAPLITVIGATGTGKSQLAVELAARFNGEIINADAMQMYKGLEVITNKIPEIEKKGVPHHLLGSIGLDQEPWTVAHFTRSALNTIEEIRSRGRLPIVVGGTHYYAQALLFHDTLSDPMSIANDAEPEMKMQGGANYSILDRSTPELLDKLREVDHVMADRWHPNDRRKIQRSLEIYLKTGRRASDIYESQRTYRREDLTHANDAREVELRETASEEDTKRPLYNEGKPDKPVPDLQSRLRFESLVFWVHAAPDVLRARLESRVDQMLKNGLLSEVESLQAYLKSEGEVQDTIDQSRGIFASIGYKEFIPFVTALTSTDVSKEELEAIKNEAILRTKRSTIRYARQQLRWIRIKLLGPAIESGLSRNLFLLDGSDLSEWSTFVEKPALDIAKAFLEGHDVPDPLSLSPAAMEMLVAGRGYDLSDRRDLWTRTNCQVCGTTLVNPNDRDIHIQSRGHRRRLKKQEKDRRGVEQGKSPPSERLLI